MHTQPNRPNPQRVSRNKDVFNGRRTIMNPEIRILNSIITQNNNRVTSKLQHLRKRMILQHPQHKLPIINHNKMTRPPIMSRRSSHPRLQQTRNNPLRNPLTSILANTPPTQNSLKRFHKTTKNIPPATTKHLHIPQEKNTLITRSSDAQKTLHP